MKTPFLLPIRRDGSFLVAADAELICHADSATDDELNYLVEAVNSHGQFMIAQGNPAEGFSYIGPFPSHEQAMIYAENKDGDWWVLEMKRPG